MLKFFFALCLLLVCFQAITAVELTTLDVQLTVNTSNPAYSYSFLAHTPDTYQVTLKSLFEVDDGSDDEVAIQSGSSVDLSKLTWTLYPPNLVVDSYGTVVPFNLTSNGLPNRFKSIVLANRLQNPGNVTDSDTKTFPSLKFDIVVNDYTFVNTSSRLAISLTLSSSDGNGKANEVEEGKSDVSYRFGDGYIAINKTATAYLNGDDDDVDVKIISPSVNSSKVSGPADVWIVYDNFKSGSNLVHDPELGYGPGPGGLSVITIIIIIAIVVVVIIAVIFIAMMVVRRRRRNAYAQF